MPLGFTMVIWFELLLGNDPTKGTLTTWQLQCSTYFPMSFHWCLKVWHLEKVPNDSIKSQYKLLEAKKSCLLIGHENRQSDSAKNKSWCRLSHIFFHSFRSVSERSPLRNPTYRKLIPPKPVQNAGDSTFLTATQLSQPLHEPTLKPNITFERNNCRKV